MAVATSVKDCIERHADYPFDIAQTELTGLQKARLVAICRWLPRRGRILDIGCNSGYMVDFHKKAKWYGVDCSLKLVEKAIARGMIADVGQAEKLDHHENFFKTAVLGDILEHVYNPTQVIKEAVRVSSNSVVGSVPTESSWWGKHTITNHQFHVRAFSEKELRDLLSPFGCVKIRTVAEHFYVFKVML